MRKSSVLRSKLLSFGTLLGATFETDVVIVVPAGNTVGKLKSTAPEKPAIDGNGTAATTAGTDSTSGSEVNGDALGIGTGVAVGEGATGLGELLELPHELSANAPARITPSAV